MKTREVKTTYRPATSNPAPVTCLSVDKDRIFAGSWDKTIYAWDRRAESKAVVEAKSSRCFVAGHSDFVKAVLAFTVGQTSLLVSASADATLIVWDADTGAKLHVLKGHARGVQALALESASNEQATVYSGDSSREIRRWHISPTSSYEVSSSGVERGGATAVGSIDALVAHETSIFALTFDADGDLWTASADKTSKCLSRAQAWKADTTLAHPDFVKAVTIHEGLGLAVTACRDENVRLWDRASSKLVHTYEGHHEEVTGLALLGDRAVSVSIDGTIRTWGLTAAAIKKATEDAEKARLGEVKEEKKNLLTAEEEAELAELMDDDDE